MKEITTSEEVESLYYKQKMRNTDIQSVFFRAFVRLSKYKEIALTIINAIEIAVTPFIRKLRWFDIFTLISTLSQTQNPFYFCEKECVVFNTRCRSNDIIH